MKGFYEKIGDKIMICCVGLFIGFFIGLYLGGIWIYIAPGIGFILGIPFDIIFMRKMHFHSTKKEHSNLFEK